MVESNAQPAATVPTVRAIEWEVSAHPAEERYQLHFHGKPLKTPANAVLRFASEALAHAVREELAGNAGKPKAETMPLYRLSVFLTDALMPVPEEYHARLLAYLDTELCCYRATYPPAVIDAQDRFWDAYLAAFEAAFHCTMVRTSGLLPIEQPEKTHRHLQEAVTDLAPVDLAIWWQGASITGSIVLGHALWEGGDAEAIWQAMSIEERHQLAQWGEDEELKIQIESKRNDLISLAKWRDLHISGAQS